MVRPSLRSRSFRKIKVRTPGSRVAIHYEKKVPKIGSCYITGEKLKGIARGFDYEIKNMPKTSKRPSRPYGGVLSSRGMRMVFKEKAKQVLG
jgi:large subunit ribosomal protein L34e